MSCYELLKKLPQDWFGIMAILAQSFDSYPQEKVAKWWFRASSSRTHWLSWVEFLESLCQLEPCIQTGNVLNFRPLFCLLPIFLQKLTLEFISRHCDEITFHIMDQFINVLTTNASDSDESVQFYVQQLRNTFNSRKEMKVKEIGSKAQEVCLPSPSFFSEHNKQNLPVEELDDVAMTVIEKQLEEDTRQLVEPVVPDITEPEEETVISSEKAMDFTVNVAKEEKSVSDDDEEQQRSACKLREFWIKDASVDPDCVTLLTTISSMQLQKVLEKLNLMSVPDAAVVLACQTFIACASMQISFQSVCIFANICLLPLVLKLELAPSRLLGSALSSFVKTYPVQSVEGLIRPLLNSSLCGAPQCDLLTKLIKDSFGSHHLLELIGVLLDSKVKLWSDHLIQIIQSLFDSKMELPLPTLRQFLIFLEYNSQAGSGNLKFGKLLLSFVKAYGSLLSPTDVKLCSQMATVHKTFISKSIKSTLSKL